MHDSNDPTPLLYEVISLIRYHNTLSESHANDMFLFGRGHSKCNLLSVRYFVIYPFSKLGKGILY